MFAQERQNKILKLIEQSNSVRVNDLCERFDVSASTIRRDLQELEEQGLLSRTHGGAVAEGKKFEPSFGQKEKKNHRAKVEIAHKAAELINNQETIILDAGTTTTELAKVLDQYENLTIITNGINIVLKLAQFSHEVIVIGGNLKERTLAMVGPIAEDNLTNFNVDKVFLGANGIDLQSGITTPDLVEASTKKKMIEVANEVIVLADHSKFNETSFIKVADLDRIDKVVTDSDINQKTLDNLQDKVQITVG